ncbi:FaeA/PapI family transcriptional regulator (plasmid) [Haloarcula salina]|uniref:FaeA/PapI family transcriptional regulator n=1 Tax=Haloarcula salina TaxID=1429914 RepID=UPI003C6F69DC
MSTRGPDPKATDEEIIELIVSAETPFVTTGDIAEAVSLSSERARQRLNQLDKQGKIDRTKVGSSAVVYWIPDSPSGSR